MVNSDDMNALLSSLEASGIKLTLEGDRLRYSAPQGALTDQLRGQIQACKPALIDFLRQNQTSRTFAPSFAQRRFWSLQKLNPNEAFYIVPFLFRLTGALNIDRLRQSLNAIVSRHEILRTTLREINGELLQVIAPGGEAQLKFAEDQGALEAEMLRPFDLAKEPGLRQLLVKTGPDQYILQFCFHNTIYDQSSLLVLLRELSAHYAALTNGAPAAMPPPTQYVDYVRWQESHAATGMDGRLQYWREWFSRGEPPALTWKHPKPEPAHGFHSHVTWQRFSPKLTRRLRTFSQRHGVTVYVTLLSAYALILWRYTDCPDIALGTTYSNRHHWSFASLIGATIDVPALRIDAGEYPDLKTVLGRMRTVVAEALTHQEVPFERVAPSLGITRTGPLFRVVLSYFAETPHNELKLPGVEVTYLEEKINELSRPDLYLVFYENGDSLTGYWMHKQDVFDRATALRMNDDLLALLEASCSA